MQTRNDSQIFCRKIKAVKGQWKQAICLLLLLIRYAARKACSVLLPVLAVAACLVLAGGGGTIRAYASSAEAGSEAKVEMDVTYGFDEYVKRGRYIPVYITLTPEEDFEGTLQILTLESDLEYYLYEESVSIEAGRTVTENMNIPLSVNSSVFYVKLLDGQGAEAASKRLKMNCEKDIGELFAGILTDVPQSMEYWNNVGLTTSYNYMKTKAIYLKQEDIPQSVMEMDLLDMLIVSSFDAKSLSKDQVETIMEWVNRGGILLLGTGERADEVLDVFAGEYIEEPYGEAEDRVINMGVEFAMSGPGDSELNLPCVSLPLNTGVVISESDDFPLLTSISKGQGKMVIAPFDFKDIQDFASRQPGYVDKLLLKLFGEEDLQEIYQETVFGSMSDYWNVQGMLGNANMDRIPNVLVYIIIIIVYVIVVGPGLYLLLKRFDKGIHFRKAVMACALICTGIIYMMGQKTRFQDPFYSYATILDIDGGQIHDETFMSIRAPFNKPYEVELNKEYHMMAMTQNNYTRYGEEPVFTGEEKPNVSIRHGNESIQVSIQDVVAFTAKSFALERTYDNTWGTGLSGSITLYDGGVIGSISNQTDWDLENVSILMYGNTISVGSLAKGETKDLAECVLKPYPVGFYYNVAGQLTGSSRFKAPEINNSEYLTALSRSNVLSYFVRNYFSTYTEEAKLIGFCADEENTGFVLNEDYKSSGVTMLSSNIQVNNLHDGQIYRPILRETPVVVNGSYESRLNATFGSDPVTLEYALGNDLEIEKVDFNLVSVDGSEENGDEEESANQYYNLFKGKMYFYNYDTGQYDEKNLDQKSFYDYELQPYLSPANNLMVRYINENESEYQWDTCLPVISVVGREK